MAKSPEIVPLQEKGCGPKASLKPLAQGWRGDWCCGLRLVLEPAMPLHSAIRNRHRDWENGTPAHVLNDLERQRTVGASLCNGARIVTLTGMAVEMAVNQRLVEPFSAPECLFLACTSQILVAAAGLEPAPKGL